MCNILEYIYIFSNFKKQPRDIKNIQWLPTIESEHWLLCDGKHFGRHTTKLQWYFFAENVSQINKFILF